MKKDSLLRMSLLYSPLLLCVGIMLPRLMSPQFGFFDDGFSMITAQRIWAGQWTLGSDPVGGRFRPVYWLYFAFPYRLFGNSPFWYFMGNLFLWLVITFCLMGLAQHLGLDQKAAWVVGFTFVISGPVLENVYNLSKPELLQAFWFMLLLFCSTYYARARNFYWKTGMVVLMAGLALLATLTKETGLLLVPATFASLLITWWGYRSIGQPGHPAVKQRGALWLGSFIGILIYVALYLGVEHRNLLGYGSGSLNYSFSWVKDQVLLLWSWMRRDYLYLVPIGLASILVIFNKPNRTRLMLLLECLVWLGLSATIDILWKYIPEYYLLPIALIAALMCGLFFSLIVNLLHGAPVIRILAWSACGLSGLLLLLTLPNQITNGRLQLAMDRANADMLGYVVKQVPQGSTVWININPPNEYTDEFSKWVTQLDGRSDLHVDYFHSQDLAKVQGREVWIVSPFMENQFYPSVRVGLYELPSRQWNATLVQYLAGRGEMVGLFQQSFTSSNLDPLRFFCPFTRSLSYCKVPDAPLDHRVFAYGWKIYRLP